MNNKAQMITIFFSLFLILAIITILGIESANLNTNENINSLIQAYNLPKLEYYNFLNVISKISTINPSNATNAIFNSTIEGIYSKLFQNLNITNQGVNTSSVVISNFGQSIPLLITNYQNIATPNPFQQMINISVSSIDNYINTTSFGQNVEFVYNNNSIIPSWLESYNSKYAIWWVKIPSIPAKGTLTIYMKFASKKTNLLNNKTTGEAPQLSPIYGEYDDGANVFLSYGDFLGTAGFDGWTPYVTSGKFTPVATSNGIEMTNDTVSEGTHILPPNSLPEEPVIVEYSWNFYGGTSPTDGEILSLFGNLNSLVGPPVVTCGGGNIASSDSVMLMVEPIGMNCSGKYIPAILDSKNNAIISTINNLPSTTPQVYTEELIISSSTTAEAGVINQSSSLSNFSQVNVPITMSGSIPYAFNFPTLMVAAGTGGGYDYNYVKWVMARAYPPNGVMPTVQILNVPPNIGYIAPLTITNHQNTATPNPFQQEVVINASRYSAIEAPNLDNIEFFYPNGTIIPSWLENGSRSSENAVYWLKIGSIPANSSINAFIGFASTNLNLFNGKTVGEAPQLSPTYGEYDDGANVFIHYGGGGNTGWSQFTYVGGTWTTANGYLQQTATGGSYSGGPTALIESASYSNTGQYILGMAFNYTTEADARVGIIAVATPTTTPDTFGYRFIGQQGSNGAGFLSFLNDEVAWVVDNTYQGAVSTPYTMVITDNAGTWSGNLYSGYEESSSPLTSLSPTSYTTANAEGATSGYVGISAAYCGSTCTTANPINVMWFYMRAYPPNGVMPSTSIGDIQNIYPFEYQYSVANFTNSTSISVPGTASTGKIWNGGHAYTLTMWVKMQHAYGRCGYPCSDLFQTNQGCTSGLEQDPYNATGYQVNLLEWNSSCGTGATAEGSPYQYVPYGKWELITGIFKYNSQGNAWIASCVDTHCTNSTWTLTEPAVYSTPATILGSQQINGKVADVQMYDSTLTLNQVNQLYKEFIGAEPVSNSTLVAWIPLDGNAYDDSGNGNTASLSSVNFLYP
ncbi:MAG: DUF2341 domain-containing protein [Candidatus Parvarchaeum sp.]